MTPNDPTHSRTSDATNGQRGHQALDCSLSVNAVVARYPSTLAIFDRFAVDTCCGGVLSVADAARAADVDPETLCGALTDAIVA